MPAAIIMPATSASSASTRRASNIYQLQLGGSGAEDASIGEIIGPGFGKDEIADAVERVIDAYLELRKDGERFLDTYRRVGIVPFKNVAYGQDLHAAY